MRDPDCVFCAIVAGETEAERILEEESFVAFLLIGVAEGMSGKSRSHA